MIRKRGRWGSVEVALITHCRCCLCKSWFISLIQLEPTRDHIISHVPRWRARKVREVCGQCLKRLVEAALIGSALGGKMK